MPRTSSLVSGTGSLRSSLRLKSAPSSDKNNAKGPPPPPTASGLKRKASSVLEPLKGGGNKRAVFEDITNAGDADRKTTSNNLKSTVRKGLTSIRSNFVGASTKKLSGVTTSKKAVVPKQARAPSTRLAVVGGSKSKGLSSSSFLQQQPPSLSRTSSLGGAKSIEGISLSDVSIEIDQEEQKNNNESGSPVPVIPPEGVNDFDKENAQDPNQCSLYASSIFDYYKSREAEFAVCDYMKGGSHPEVNETMRSILVDWLVEVQESFELNHETLYTSVKIFDLYLSLEKRAIKKDELQLIGATACLIACKVDERLPPPLDDFVYVCDDAYSREQIIVMERKIIQAVKYDVGYPLSYRFLRRYGRVCNVPMSILTLARYILEMSLMEYEFNIVGMSESKLAASALILAFKIHGIEGWVDTLKFYSGYSPAKDLKEIVMKLLKIIVKPRRPNLKTIRDKYSHMVFHEVALVKIPSVIEVVED